MSKAALLQQAERLLPVIREIIRFKFNKRFAPPEELARVKKLIQLRHRGDDRRVHEDLELFGRIGALLVDREEAMTMGELSEALEVPLSTTTRVVDWQVKHGFIERRADPNDRRIVRVAFSRTGKELHRNVTAMIQKQIGDILQEFPAKEREQFVASMEKLAEILKKMAG